MIFARRITITRAEGPMEKCGKTMEFHGPTAFHAAHCWMLTQGSTFPEKGAATISMTARSSGRMARSSAVGWMPNIPASRTMTSTREDMPRSTFSLFRGGGGQGT